MPSPRSPVAATPLLFSFALASIGLTAVGCKEEPPRADPSTSAPSPSPRPRATAKPAAKTPDGAKITWEETPYGGGPKVRIDALGAKGDISCVGPRCLVGLRPLPEGTQVKLGEEATTLTHTSFSGKLDLGERIGKSTPKEILGAESKLDPETTLHITFPDGVELSSKLPALTLKFSLEAHLKADLAKGTPVLFGDESTDPVTPHSTLCLFGVASLGDDVVIGPAKTMREVDRVAISENLPKRPANKKCSGYKAAGETTTRELDLFLVDTQVKIVDRRTAQVVEEKKFEPSPTCPMTALGDEATTYPDDAAVIAWIRTKT